MGLTLAWLAVVLFATLRPSAHALTTSGFCVICGERGLADALLNILLFAPLGLGGRRLGLSLPSLLLAGFLLSGAVETAQFFTPGRDASVGDVIMNSIGTWVGGALCPSLGGLLRPGKAAARRLTLSWGVALMIHIVAMAWLLEPQLEGDSGRLDLHPPSPDGESYEGIVLAQRLDGTSVLEGAIVGWGRDSDRSERLEFDLESAPVVTRYRPFVGLSAPGESTPRLSLGPAGFSLVLRIARPVDRLRLTPADLSQAGALNGFQGGNRFTVSVWRGGESYCLSIDRRTQCGFGFTVGSGWALLSPVGWGNGGLDRGLDALWVGLLLLPLGYWGRGGPVFWLTAAGVLSVGLAATALSQLLWVPLVTLGGMVGGLVAGYGAFRLLETADSEGSGYQQIP